MSTVRLVRRGAYMYLHRVTLVGWYGFDSLFYLFVVKRHAYYYLDVIVRGRFSHS